MIRFVLCSVLLLSFAIPANAQTASTSSTSSQWAEVDVYSWVGLSSGTTKDVAQDDDREPTTGVKTTANSYSASVSNVDATYNGGDDIAECHSCYFTTDVSFYSDYVRAQTLWSFDVDIKTAGYEAEMECEGTVDAQGDIKYTGGDATEVLRFDIDFTLRRPDVDSINNFKWKYIAEVGPYNKATAEYDKANDRWKIHGYKMSSTGTGLPTVFTDYVNADSNGAAVKHYHFYRQQNRDQAEPMRCQVLADGVDNFVELIVDDVNVHADGNSMLNRVEIKFDAFEP